MPKLFLHVGLPKTATTSIQRFLLHNREKLIAHGVLYPRAGLQNFAHHPLSTAFRKGGADWIKPVEPDVLARSLRGEIEATGCDTVIMSTEALSYVPQITEVKDYFQDFDTDIVFYLRRQDKWLESAYKSNLKTGATDLAPDVYMKKQLPRLDYYEWLGHWAEVFGNEHIRVAVFEKGAVPQSVERTFLEVLNIEFQPEYEVSDASNTELSRDCLSFLGAMTAKRRISHRSWIYAGILSNYTRQHPDPQEWNRVWPPSQRRAVAEGFADSNARVAREYCGREDGILFHENLPSDDEPWEEYPGLTATKAVEIAEFLADSLFDRAEAARQKRQSKNQR